MSKAHVSDFEIIHGRAVRHNPTSAQFFTASSDADNVTISSWHRGSIDALPEWELEDVRAVALRVLQGLARHRGT